MKLWSRLFRRPQDAVPETVPVLDLEPAKPVRQASAVPAAATTENQYAVNLDLVKKMIAAEPQGAQVLTQTQQMFPGSDSGYSIYYRSVWTDAKWETQWNNPGYYFGFPARITDIMAYVWSTTQDKPWRFGLDVDKKRIVSTVIPTAKAGFFLLDNLAIRVSEKNVVTCSAQPGRESSGLVYAGFQVKFHWI